MSVKFTFLRTFAIKMTEILFSLSIDPAKWPVIKPKQEIHAQWIRHVRILMMLIFRSGTDS